MLRCADLVTFLGQELSANAKIDMDKDKEKLEKVITTTHPPRSQAVCTTVSPYRAPPHTARPIGNAAHCTRQHLAGEQ